MHETVDRLHAIGNAMVTGVARSARERGREGRGLARHGGSCIDGAKGEKVGQVNRWDRKGREREKIKTKIYSTCRWILHVRASSTMLPKSNLLLLDLGRHIFFLFAPATLPKIEPPLNPSL